MLWYSSEGCRQGTSDEYPKHRFSWNQKNNMGYPSYLELSFNFWQKVTIKQQYSEQWEWIPRTEIREEFEVSKYLLSVIILKENYQE